jgi:hypothetical protein
MATHALHLRQIETDPWTARVALAICLWARRRHARVGIVPAPPAPDMNTSIYRLAPRV